MRGAPTRLSEEEKTAWRRAGERYRAKRAEKKRRKKKGGGKVVSPAPTASPGRKRRRVHSQDATPPVQRGRIQVVIMTYERPLSLLALLRDVHAWGRQYDLFVSVYDDASDADYTAAREMLDALGWRFIRADEHHGKHLFWRWISRAYADQKQSPADFFVFLPDDARLCVDFFDRVRSQWASIKDPHKTTLTVLHDSGGNRGWTKQTSHSVGGVLRTGCVDGAFAASRRFFEALEYTCPPVSPHRWDRNKMLGSGVGMAVSVRLHRLGLSMYSVKRSLIAHTGVAHSHMNPHERSIHPLRAVRFIDGERAHERLLGEEPQVVVSLASVARRRRLLRKVISSLYWQVDRINVYLNGYDDVPGFLMRPRIHVATSQEHGDRGDAGKFYWAEELGPDCYHFTCDDDILYPPDYVARMRHKIEQYGRAAVVAVHGAVLPTCPIRSYYRERSVVFRCTRRVSRDVPVHVPGTGVLGYHSSTIAFDRTMFRHPNMADIWVAIAAKKQGIPVIVASHSADWLRDLPDPTPRLSVFARYASRDSIQTKIVQRAAPWTTPRLPGVAV